MGNSRIRYDSLKDEKKVVEGGGSRSIVTLIEDGIRAGRYKVPAEDY